VSASIAFFTTSIARPRKSVFDMVEVRGLQSGKNRGKQSSKEEGCWKGQRQVDLVRYPLNSLPWFSPSRMRICGGSRSTEVDVGTTRGREGIECHGWRYAIGVRSCFSMTLLAGEAVFLVTKRSLFMLSCEMTIKVLSLLVWVAPRWDMMMALARHQPALENLLQPHEATLRQLSGQDTSGDEE
jgi:hypothetical protein